MGRTRAELSGLRDLGAEQQCLMDMEKDVMQGRVWAIKSLKSNQQGLKLNREVAHVGDRTAA